MAAANKSFILFFFFLSFAWIIPTLHANIAEFDNYWKQRATEAQEAALEAFNPNPVDVTNQFNLDVEESVDNGETNSTGWAVEGTTNSTRRNLRKFVGPCLATNPIDRCWRCNRNWARNRKRLADCVLGFGHRTVGGQKGRFYVVSDSSDNDMVNPKIGTLRHAVIQKGPLWIIFHRSMMIRLNQELIMTSDKTIDARGANVHIAYGAGITIQFVNNVIIHGLHIHHIVQGSGGTIRDSVDHVGFRTMSDGDAISIYGSTNVWIDHVSMSKCTDGLIDVIMGSTAITISNSHFTHHNDVMLFGASDSYTPDSKMQITVAFNHFGKGLIQRMPRCRLGFFHIVNNDYTHWNMYAIGGSQHPTIISQGNRFIAPPDVRAKEVTKRDYASESQWKSWTWRSEGDLMMNGAFFVESGRPLLRKPFDRYDMIKAKSGRNAGRMTRFSGSLGCKIGRPC